MANSQNNEKKFLNNDLISEKNLKKIHDCELKIDELEKKLFDMHAAHESNRNSDSEKLRTQISQNANHISALQTQQQTNTTSILQNTNAISSLQNTKQNTLTFDNRPTQNSANPVTSGGVFSALSAKQNTLTAGSNITISNNIISANIDTSNLQPKLTAGSNITIDANNQISATATTYTAGENIRISNGTISATDTKYSAGSGISIENGVISATSQSGGLTEVTASDVNSGSATSGQVLAANGNGGASWQTISPGLSSVQDGNIDSETATQGQVLTADGNGGANWGNVSGGLTQEQLSQLAELYQDYMSRHTPADPSYQPKTFSDYPEGTILQTYAKFNQRYSKTYSSTLTTPIFVFSAENGSAGNLDIEIKFTTSVTFTGIVQIYKNDVEILNETVAFNSLSHTYQKSFVNIELADGNIFYVKILANPSSTSFTLTNVKAELVAPNAEVINQISPFNVEYLYGKYYVSDCTSGTAKIAEIDVQDINNISNLTWTDTEIDCLSYRTSFAFTQYGDIWAPEYKIDYYLKPNDVTTFLNRKLNKTKNATALYFPDWAPTCSSSFQNTYLAANRNTNNIGRYALYIGLTSGTYSAFSGSAFHPAVSASKLHIDLNSNWDAYAGVVTSPNNTLSAGYFSANATQLLTLGKGINAHTYWVNANTSNPTFVCYAKYYNKIVKYSYAYSSSALSLTSIEEIGEYDEYFEGVNNDYFVVKNGQLEYHKKTSN